MQGIYPTFHVSRLRKHHPDNIEHRKINAPSPIQVNGEEEWEVEEVLDKRRRGKGVQYLVSWKGFGPKENLWEPEAHLENCREIKDNVDRQFPQAANHHRRRRQRK
jgi:hypothetical protein